MRPNPTAAFAPRVTPVRTARPVQAAFTRAAQRPASKTMQTRPTQAVRRGATALPASPPKTARRSAPATVSATLRATPRSTKPTQDATAQRGKSSARGCVSSAAPTRIVRTTCPVRAELAKAAKQVGARAMGTRTTARRTSIRRATVARAGTAAAASRADAESSALADRTATRAGKRSRVAVSWGKYRRGP